MLSEKRTAWLSELNGLTGPSTKRAQPFRNDRLSKLVVPSLCALFVLEP
jgi:hypothetical protein